MKAWYTLPLLGMLMFCNKAADFKDQRDWYTLLPDCPCRNPDQNGVQLNDGWAVDKGDIQVYHPGAATCFRSYPYVATAEGKSGQQCCYDARGLLIRAGAGAGTPDKVSTCAGEDKSGLMTLRISGIAGHFWKDVRPWKKAGVSDSAWKSYNMKWVPNQGKDCP